MNNVLKFTGKWNNDSAPANTLGPINDELVQEIGERLQELIDEHENNWNAEGYEYLIHEAEHDAIIREFERNFSYRKLDGAAVIEQLRDAGKSDDAIVQLIIDCSTMRADRCLYVKNNEVFSVIIGEIDDEIDLGGDEVMAKLLSQASPADRFAAGIKDTTLCVYYRPCERLVWTVDALSIVDAIEALNEKGA